MAELTLDDQIAKLKAQLAQLEALKQTSRPIRRRVSDKLTDKRIKVIIKSGRDTLVGDGRNLYLRLRNGSALWMVRYKRRDYLRLGGYPEVTLAEARLKRNALLDAIRSGRDPIAEYRDQQQAAKLRQARRMTFKQCAEAYLAAHEGEWKNPRHAQIWLRSLSAIAFPVFGDFDVAEIDTKLVFNALQAVWTTRTVTATRVRGRVEQVLNWAAAAGHRPKDVLNPAVWKNHLEHMLGKPSKLAEVKHLADLPFAEMPEFWAKLAADTSVGALALKLAILGACRSKEVLGARWEEFDDPDNPTSWTIPASRMKGGHEHIVPVTDAMRDILRTLRQLPASPLVFSWAQRRKDGGTVIRPVGPMIMRKVLAKYGRSDLTQHGFRSTFSTWVSERTHFPAELREMALAHLVGNKVERAYRRGDLFERRRELMQAWADYCTNPAPEGEVIAFPTVRQSA